MLFILESDDDRRILEKELGHPSKTVLLVRGDDAGTGGLVQRADHATMHAPWRTVIWVRHRGILGASEERRFFEGNPEAIGVILDLNDDVAAYLTGGEQSWQIDRAFREAESR